MPTRERGRSAGPVHGGRRPRGPVLAAATAVVVICAMALAAAAVLTGDDAAGPSPPAASRPVPAEPGGSPGTPGAGEAAYAGGSALPPVAPGTAEDHVARARRLLAVNSGSAADPTREGVTEAEAEILAAIRQGYGDRAAAYRLLADVYATHREWEARDEMRRAYGRQEREALRVALEETPGDGELRYRLAMLQDERGARVEELGRAVRDAPHDLRPRRALGEELLGSGRSDEGARLLVEAAEMADREQLGVIGPDVVHLLRQHGREEEEARVRDRMERLGY